MIGRIIEILSAFIVATISTLGYAGVARMNLKKFIIYTFAGSLPWCLALAYVGQKLGEQWDKDPRLKNLFHRFDFVIGILIVLAVAWWIWRHVRHTQNAMG